MANALEIINTQEAKNGFYPTPRSVAEKLLTGIDWCLVQSVLEPSAGKGDLVKTTVDLFVADIGKYSGRELEVDCIERDPYLRSILNYEFGGQRESELYERKRSLENNRKYDRDRGCYVEYTEEQKAELKQIEVDLKRLEHLNAHVVHDDFLTYDSRKRYDIIIMNPPFADGDAHLLKAIEMQRRSGGGIRCILNAETLLNPYTNRRKVLLQFIEELGATVEFVDGAFTDAERKTDVQVALVSFNIEKPQERSAIYDRLQEAAERETPPADNPTELVVNDFLLQIVSRYNVEIDAGLELIRQYEALRPYILDDFEEKGAPNLTLVVGDPHRTYKGDSPIPNKYIALVRRKYWNALLHNKEFIGKLTSNLQQKYQGMISELVNYDFTLFNIQQISAQMNAEMAVGVKETILSMFEKLTNQHTWYPEMQKNIHYYNGWKTNKAHKVNNKVIIPTYGVFADLLWSKKTFNVREAESNISDIEKVFNYLDGNMTAPVDLHGVLLQACEEGRTKNIPCKFFDVTLYKKGTMHIKFRNQELLDRFNIYVARNRGWLPPNYGKTAYSNMTEEEKAVIDDFQGAEEYEKVMARPGYFLSEPTKELPALMAAM